MSPRSIIGITIGLIPKYLNGGLQLQKLGNMFTHFETIRERLGRTDGKTWHDGIGHIVRSIAWQKYFKLHLSSR